MGSVSAQFAKKCKLRSGYRIKQVKTRKVIRKKYSEIVKYLGECAKDARVQYLVVFEEGKLGWYGIQNDNAEQDEKQEDVENVNVPIIASPIQQKSLTDNDAKIESDEDEQSGYDESDSMIVHSDDSNVDEIKQFVPDTDTQSTRVIKENEVVIADEDTKIQSDETKQIDEQKIGIAIEDKKTEKKVDTKRKSMKKIKNKKESKADEKSKLELTDANNIRTPAKRMRTRYVAQIKDIFIAAPFDSNETLSAFKREIVSKIGSHKKLKKQKNLSKRIKFIKLKTPTFPMLIDCNPKNKLCEIATRKDVIVFHTESDDEDGQEGNAYFVDKLD